MPPLPFQGKASALSSDGLGAVGNQLGVGAAEIWTVLAIETSGCGFLPDRRPKILFERHLFHRFTGGQFDDGDISDPAQGGYGRGGAHQYDRLARAMTKDRQAALKSASWGVGQILGENFSLAGFESVDDMVAAMSESEDRQLAAMGSFLVSTRLHTPLKAHDWTSFARGYDGPNFAINQYDDRLKAEFQKYSAGSLPDLNVRTTQLYLTYLGFNPGQIDGLRGQHTLSALAEFQAKRGIPKTTVIDQDVVAALVTALEQALAASA